MTPRVTTTARRDRRRSRHEAIRAALREHGPMTAERIAEVTGLWIVAVRSDLDNFHVGLVRTGYVRKDGELYSLGASDDA